MLIISSVAGTDITCNGIPDGTIIINSALATGFSIDNGATYQASNTFAGLAAGTYPIMVENANGCTQTHSIDLVQPTPVVLAAIDTIDICYDGYGTLEAFASGGTAPYYYVWDNVDTVQYYGVSGLIVPTDFTCTVYDYNGCQSTTSEIGHVNIPYAPFQASATPLTSSICPGGSVTITGAGQDGWQGGPYNYEWITMQMDTINLGDNPFTYSPTWIGTDSIYMVGYDDYCYHFDTVVVAITVNENPSPTFDVVAGNCAPSTATFTNTTIPMLPGGTCVWDFGDGNTFNGCNGVSNIYLTPGCNDVTLEVTTVDGCYGTATVASAVCIAEDPIPGFYWEPALPTILDPTVTFVDISSGGNTYAYTFDGQGSSSDQNPTHTFTGVDVETTFNVCQTVTSVEGCIADTCIDVTIYETVLFYIPNSFTPDGDIFNEEFKPVFTAGVDPYEYHMTIFNRWGEIMFESYNYDNGWDGHFGNGGLVKDGVYVWQVEFGEKISDEKHTHRGHVTVLK